MALSDKPRQLAALFRPFERPPEAKSVRPAPPPSKYPLSTEAITEAFTSLISRVYLAPAGASLRESDLRIANQITWPLELHWTLPRTTAGLYAASRFVSDMAGLAPKTTTVRDGFFEVAVSFPHPRDALKTLRAMAEEKGDQVYGPETLCLKRSEDEQEDALTDKLLAQSNQAYIDGIKRGFGIFEALRGTFMQNLPSMAFTTREDSVGHAYFNTAHAMGMGCVLIDFHKLEHALAIDTHQPSPHPLAALH